jgi:hypothetical protein
MKPDDENIVAIRTFINEFEAERAKGILEAEGIECCVSSDDIGGMGPPQQLIEGIKLLVLEEDVKRAKEILDAYDSFTPEEENK